MHIRVKRVIAGAFITLAAFMVGCSTTNAKTYSNKMFTTEFKTNYFDKAVINLYDEVIEVGVSGWYEYEDSNTLLIETTDGERYYTTIYACTLICTDINR